MIAGTVACAAVTATLAVKNLWTGGEVSKEKSILFVKRFSFCTFKYVAYNITIGSKLASQV